MRVPGGGASSLGVGRPESGTLPPPTTHLFGREAGARFPLAVGAVCGRGGPAVLGTLSRAAVRRVLCALPRFAAPGGCCGLAPVLVPWLWPAACLSGIPRGPALVCRSSSGPVALGAPVGFAVAVVPSPTPGAVAPGLTGWLRRARGGRPRTGLIVPAAGPWARSASYPFGAPRWGCPWRVPPASVLGCVRCGALVFVDPVTDASGFPYRPSCDGGLGRCTRAVSCGRRNRPYRVGGRHARLPRVCACACPAWPGRAGRPSGRVLVRLTFPLAVLGSLFACSAPSGLGLPCLWLLLVSFFGFVSPFPLPPPRCALVVSCFPCFPAPGALGLGVLLPPPFFFAPPTSCCLWRFLLSGCMGPLPHPPFFLFFLFFLFPFFFCFFVAGRAVRGGLVCLGPSGVPVCASVVLSLSLLCVRWLVLRGVRCWAWLSSAVSWWVLVSCFGGAVLVWPRGSPPCGSAWCVLVFRCPVLCSVALCCRMVVCCPALPFVCVVACACCSFLAAARLLCVFWGVVLCVTVLSALCSGVLRCAGALSLCCARHLCCFWWLVLLVPGVPAFCWGSAGGSGCPALSFGGVCRLWCPCLVWPSLGVLRVVSCSPVLCPVALCCRVVLCCGALSSFFVFLLAGGAGFLLFPVRSGPWAGSGSFLFLCSARAVLVSAANPHLLRFSQICHRLATFWSFSLLRRNRRLAAQSQDQTYIFLICRI